MGRSPVTLLLALAACLALAGCDTSFDAFEETDLAYSVFGYLDAHADTQFVRVEPVQDSTFAGSEGSAPLDAHVTTENVATGETVVWRDSTFRLGANGVPVHNFTTTAEIAPEATYRFRVEGAAGTSTAEVTLPDSTIQVEIANALPSSPIGVTVRGAERLGAVVLDMRYSICTAFSCTPRHEARSWLNAARRVGEKHYTVALTWLSRLQAETRDSVEIVPEAFTLRVASVSEDWPAYDLSLDTLAQRPLPPPGINSNVEGGTGYLGGAAVRTKPIPRAQ